MSLLLVALIRTGLCMLPFGRLRGLVEGYARHVYRSGAWVEPGRLRWAIQASSRLVPGATCLTQALALQVLLARHGHQSSVRIGVLRDSTRFDAHAWIETGGKILMGGDRLERYAPLWTLETHPTR